MTASQAADANGTSGAVTRLDSFIRRLEAQRACLDHAAGLIASLPGIVIELGLGNGRTYDHLRERLPGREIFVFEREPDAHPACVPDPGHLIIGELEDTLKFAQLRLPMPAAMVHSDIGTGDAARNEHVAARVASLLPPLLCAEAVIVSDQLLSAVSLEPIAPPSGVRPGRYFMYRHKP